MRLYPREAMTLVPYLGLQDPVSSLSHLTAAAIAIAGGFFLYRRGRGDALRTWSLLVFSISMLVLFSMSGVYHALEPGPWRAFFRRMDYAAIWIVIAGSATPVHILLFQGRWRWGLTALFWGCALTCLVLIDVYFDTMPYWAIVSCYVGLGSLGTVSFARITAKYGFRKAALLFIGGIAYSMGAVIDAVEIPVIVPGVLGPHELFHFLVITGAVLHWCFIYNWAGRVIMPAMPGSAPTPPPADAEPA